MTRLFFRFPARALALACAALAVAGPALAQDGSYPAKPVTLVTPFAAGSGPDAVLRLVGEKLGALWKQRVLVDNRPGGAGFIAIDAIRRATPDGYTLLQLDSEHLAALPHLYSKRNFRPFEAFDPVAALFRTPFLVTVSAQSKWKSMADLIAAAKANPEGLSYGSWAVGSPGHLGGGLLESETGTRMRHVPYRDTGQLFTSVAVGDLDWSFGSVPSSQGPYKAGKLKYLAVAAPKRIPQFPDVPTVAESGGPANIDVNSFVVLVAPKGIPAAVQARIGSDVAKVLADAEVRKKFDGFAFEPLAWSPQEIARQAEAKSTQYGALIKRANISLE